MEAAAVLVVHCRVSGYDGACDPRHWHLVSKPLANMPTSWYILCC